MEASTPPHAHMHTHTCTLAHTCTRTHMHYSHRQKLPVGPDLKAREPYAPASSCQPQHTPWSPCCVSRPEWLSRCSLWSWGLRPQIVPSALGKRGREVSRSVYAATTRAPSVAGLVTALDELPSPQPAVPDPAPRPPLQAAPSLVDAKPPRGGPPPGGTGPGGVRPAPPPCLPTSAFL